MLIEDCEPDVCGLAETLLSHARYVVVKLSPMLDIAAATRALGCVHQVHVVGHGGECKDLLLVLKQGPRIRARLCVITGARLASRHTTRLPLCHNMLHRWGLIFTSLGLQQ